MWHASRFPNHPLSRWWYRSRYGNASYLQDSWRIPRSYDGYFLCHAFSKGECWIEVAYILLIVRSRRGSQRCFFIILPPSLYRSLIPLLNHTTPLFLSINLLKTLTRPSVSTTKLFTTFVSVPSSSPLQSTEISTTLSLWSCLVSLHVFVSLVNSTLI